MRKIFLIISGALLLQNGMAQKIDRTQPPKPGPAPTIKIGNPVKYQLSNGITVLVVENHKLPKVTASYSIDAGPITEGAKTGSLDLMGQMLGEGTKVRSKAAFDEAVDRMGANVNLSANGGSASSLTRYFDSAFMLMAEALQKPAFKKESFDKLKSQYITGLKSNEKSVTAVASRVTSALMFGTEHPSGEFATEESITSLSLNDVEQAYKKYVSPSRGYLTFVGDITPVKAKALAEKAFAGWKGAPVSLEKLAVVSNPEKTVVNLVDMPNAVQSEIRITNLVSIPMSSPDYFPVLLANYLLGGGADSKLFLNLREKHGFTYGAYSSVGSGRFQAAFVASAAVRNAKTDSAVGEVLKEINTMHTEKVSEQELKNAKALYNGSFALGLENPARVATFASNILINDLPADFYRTYLQKVNAVTTDDIQRVAKKYFNFNNSRVIVVGKASDVAEGLKNLHYPVETFDRYARPVKEMSQSNDNTTTAKVDAQKIISDYLSAIGGVEALKNVKSITMTFGMEMQGMNLEVAQKKLFPNKELTIVTMMGNVVNKTVFDGSAGYMEQMGQKKPMTDDELKDKKSQASLFDQLDYNSPGYKLLVQGTEKVNGKDAYKIQVTTPSGKNQTEYYDVDSKLLVKMEKTQEANNMTVMNTVEFSDYKKEGTILFPHSQKVSVSAGGQQQEFEMKMSKVQINEGVTAEEFK